MGELQGWAHREAASALSSERANLLGARPFLAMSFSEGDALPHTEIVKACAFDGGHVEEQVLTRARINKSKTAIG
jgi:hypothetical protein